MWLWQVGAFQSEDEQNNVRVAICPLTGTRPSVCYTMASRCMLHNLWLKDKISSQPCKSMVRFDLTAWKTTDMPSIFYSANAEHWLLYQLVRGPRDGPFLGARTKSHAGCSPWIVTLIGIRDGYTRSITPGFVDKWSTMWERFLAFSLRLLWCSCSLGRY